MEDVKREFNLIHKDHIQGQDNYILQYSPSQEGETVGYILFNIFEDELHIDMIEIYDLYKNKGYAKELVKELQRLYPDTEIHFGMTTEGGTKLQQSLSYKKIKSPYYDKFQELSKLKAQLKQFNKKIDKFYSQDLSQIPQEEKDAFSDMLDEYNEVRDRMNDLEEELYDEKPYKYIIET